MSLPIVGLALVKILQYNIAGMKKGIWGANKKGVDMIDKIDVHDLPEEQAGIVREFVEFLRARHRGKSTASEESEFAALSIGSFAEDWDNRKDAIYDDWKEKYNVRER